MNTPKKPGENPPKPGPYVEVKPDKKPGSPPNVVVMPPGHKPLPPTEKPGDKWVPIKK
jgi:hypothetical protein